MTKIYIAGKITGEPISECLWKFYKARSEVRRMEIFTSAENATTIEPLELPGIVFGINHNDAMSICFNALKGCDAIYMLSDWEDSPGAKLEHSQAKDWGLQILYQDNKSTP